MNRIMVKLGGYIKYVRSTICSFGIFLLPSCLLRFIFKKKVKIGFSWIRVRTLYLEDNVRIGHLNFIDASVLVMRSGSRVEHLNVIRNTGRVFMGKNSAIRIQNKISGLPENTKNFYLGEKSYIVCQHMFDLTESIYIGKNTVFAGAGSQVWTHYFISTESFWGHHRVDMPVAIGNNCNISTRCIICAGTNITDKVVLGASSVVSKDIKYPGLYVNQSLRRFEYDAESKLSSMKLVLISGEFHVLKF